MWSEWWNRFLASDPAFRRLRTATRVTLSVAATLLAMVPLLSWAGSPPKLALIGAIVAINSSVAVNDETEPQRRITTALMPLPAAFSLVLATVSAEQMWLNNLLFLLVIFTATYVRRFGSRYFALGMVGFTGYFFALFLRPELPQLPILLVAAVCGAVMSFVMRFLILRDDPQGILDRGRNTLRAQVHGLLHAVRDVAEHPESHKPRKRLHNRSVRLNQTALMLENTVEQLDSLGASGRERLRQRILDVELAAENLLTPLIRVVDHPSGGRTLPRALGAMLAVLRTDPSRIREAAQSVADRVEQEDSVEIAMAIRRLGAGLADLAAARDDLGKGSPDESEEQRANGKTEDGEEKAKDSETGLRRPEVRTAVQVTCATAAAIVFGQLISPNRWYWAVITAFVVFISANSRGELLVRAWQRTAGTILGVLAGIFVAIQVTGNVGAELSTILICVFLAFYFVGYSYAVMTFFITTMLGALYGMLGSFHVAVLGTRLAETALGALAGVLAAVFVLPTRTRSLVRSNTEDFLLSLRDFLRELGSDPSERATIATLRESMRELDDQLHELVRSTRPLTSYRPRSQHGRIDRSLTIASGCAFYVRNLVVVLPHTVEMVDEDTRARLAELLRGLADAAESMTEESTAEFATTLRLAQQRSDELHDLADALPSGPTSLHHTLTLLERVSQTLDDLAEELGFSPAGRTK